jgi:translation initiation factor eIF-2B subunit gamma
MSVLAQASRDPLHEALLRSTSSFTPSSTADSAALKSSPGTNAATLPPSPTSSSDTGSDIEGNELYQALNGGTEDRRRKARAPFTWSCQVMVWTAPETPTAAPTTGKQQAKGKPIAPEPTEALLRANTIGSYWELNRNFLRAMTPNVQPFTGSGRPAQAGTSGTPNASVSSTSVPLISPSAQISPDSLLGESTRVGDRASIKKCVVGRHCVIGRGAKLVGCVLWDFVVVEEK